VTTAMIKKYIEYHRQKEKLPEQLQLF